MIYSVCNLMGVISWVYGLSILLFPLGCNPFREDTQNNSYY